MLQNAFRCSVSSVEVFGLVLIGLSEQQLHRESLPGTKFGASEQPQHTTHTQDAQEHTRTHTHSYTQAAADGETILATLKHGSHTRLHVLKPVRLLKRVESSSAERIKRFCFLHHLAKHDSNHQLRDRARFRFAAPRQETQQPLQNILMTAVVTLQIILYVIFPEILSGLLELPNTFVESKVTCEYDYII